LEYERMLKLEDIDKEIRDVQKRMIRFIETGDLRRLARLRCRLAKLQADLDILKAARTPPSFRKSYRFEAWCEELATGRKTFL
jgi:ABC-type phosphate transport system auxiliary subunit